MTLVISLKSSVLREESKRTRERAREPERESKGTRERAREQGESKRTRDHDITVKL